MKRFMVAFALACVPLLTFLVQSHARVDREANLPQVPEITQLTHTGGAYWPSWSPDGKRIAYYNRISTYIEEFGRDRQEPVCDLWIMNADGSGMHQLWDGEIRGVLGSDIHPPSWSHESRFLSVDTHHVRQTLILDVETGRQVSESLIPNEVAAVRFSPSSPRLVYSALFYDFSPERIIEERSVFVLDYQTGEKRLLVTTGWNAETEWDEWPSVWSHDGSMLRTWDRSRAEIKFLFYSVDSGELVFSYDSPMGEDRFHDFFPDHSITSSGEWKVVAPSIQDVEYSSINHNGRGSVLKVYRATDKGLVALALQSDTYIHSFQWHPKEDLLLFCAGRNSTRPNMVEIANLYIARFSRDQGREAGPRW